VLILIWCAPLCINNTSLTQPFPYPIPAYAILGYFLYITKVLHFHSRVLSYLYRWYIGAPIRTYSSSNRGLQEWCFTINTSTRQLYLEKYGSPTLPSASAQGGGRKQYGDQKINQHVAIFIGGFLRFPACVLRQLSWACIKEWSFSWCAG
jgi:hypothetical protein